MTLNFNPNHGLPVSVCRACKASPLFQSRLLGDSPCPLGFERCALSLQTSEMAAKCLPALQDVAITLRQTADPDPARLYLVHDKVDWAANAIHLSIYDDSLPLLSNFVANQVDHHFSNSANEVLMDIRFTPDGSRDMRSIPLGRIESLLRILRLAPHTPSLGERSVLMEPLLQLPALAPSEGPDF